MLANLQQRIETAHDFYKLPRWKLLWLSMKAGRNPDTWYLAVAQAAFSHKGREYYTCTAGTCIIVWDIRTEDHIIIGRDECPCVHAQDPRGKEIT